MGFWPRKGDLQLEKVVQWELKAAYAENQMMGTFKLSGEQ